MPASRHWAATASQVADCHSSSIEISEHPVSVWTVS